MKSLSEIREVLKKSRIENEDYKRIIEFIYSLHEEIEKDELTTGILKQKPEINAKWEQIKKDVEQYQTPENFLEHHKPEALKAYCADIKELYIDLAHQIERIFDNKKAAMSNEIKTLYDNFRKIKLPSEEKNYYDSESQNLNDLLFSWPKDHNFSKKKILCDGIELKKNELTQLYDKQIKTLLGPLQEKIIQTKNLINFYEQYKRSENVEKLKDQVKLSEKAVEGMRKDISLYFKDGEGHAAKLDNHITLISNELNKEKEEMNALLSTLEENKSIIRAQDPKGEESEYLIKFNEFSKRLNDFNARVEAFLETGVDGNPSQLNISTINQEIETEHKNFNNYFINTWNNKRKEILQKVTSRQEALNSDINRYEFLKEPLSQIREALNNQKNNILAQKEMDTEDSEATLGKIKQTIETQELAVNNLLMQHNQLTPQGINGFIASVEPALEKINSLFENNKTQEQITISKQLEKEIADLKTIGKNELDNEALKKIAHQEQHITQHLLDYKNSIGLELITSAYEGLLKEVDEKVVHLEAVKNWNESFDKPNDAELVALIGTLRVLKIGNIGAAHFLNTALDKYIKFKESVTQLEEGYESFLTPYIEQKRSIYRSNVPKRAMSQSFRLFQLKLLPWIIQISL